MKLREVVGDKNVSINKSNEQTKPNKNGDTGKGVVVTRGGGLGRKKWVKDQLYSDGWKLHCWSRSRRVYRNRNSVVCMKFL